jgi:hypothetical protein
LLRLPTGIFYAQGVKANPESFRGKPAAEKPWSASRTAEEQLQELRHKKQWVFERDSSRLPSQPC